MIRHSLANSRYNVVFAISLTALVWLPATSPAQSPGGADPAALEEAQRLSREVVRLYGQGSYDAALPLAERALAIYEKALGPAHPFVATSLDNLAGLYRAKGDYGQAEPLSQRALAIYEKALGPEHPDVAMSLGNLAELYRVKGDYGRAAPLSQRALAIYEKALGPEHPDVAMSLNNLAEPCRAKGDYGRAEPLYQRALAIFENGLGPEHSDLATSLNNLGVPYWARHDVGRAVTLQARAADVRERNLRLVLDTGVEDQKRAYLATLTGETHATISLHSDFGRNDLAALHLALTTVLQRKGRVLDAMAESLAILRRRLRPEDASLFEQWASARGELAALTLKGSGESAARVTRERVTALAARAEQLEAQLSARSTELREHARPVTLERVHQAIPSGAALVEIVSYKPFDPRAQTPSRRRGASRYVAYVLRDQGEPAWVDLGDAAAIDRGVARLREALADPDRADVKKLSRALDERVMRPLRPLLGESRTLLLSPDGALNLIPFGALVDETDRYLVERFSFVYLTTGRDLLRLHGRGVRRSGPLMVADPDFDDTGARAVAPATAMGRAGQPRRSADFSGMQFPRLPGTTGEAKALARLLPEATVLTRAGATEAALKKAQGPGILHVATHGFFLEDQPQPLGSELSQRDIGVSEAALSPGPVAWAENPLLRSGLALAGANGLRSGDEDGVLTALEAAGLDLWGTKLVVLSACETGVGKTTTGEGVYGLRRALVMAGAESQVLSLWKVADEPTRDLMAAYYRRLLAGEGRAEALRQAQLEMLKNADQSHPFFWASFIAGGDWRPIEGLGGERNR